MQRVQARLSWFARASQTRNPEKGLLGKVTELAHHSEHANHRSASLGTPLHASADEFTDTSYFDGLLQSMETTEFKSEFAEIVSGRV